MTACSPFSTGPRQPGFSGPEIFVSAVLALAIVVAAIFGGFADKVERGGTPLPQCSPAELLPTPPINARFYDPRGIDLLFFFRLQEEPGEIVI
jgi:hypothetical protein